MDRRSGRKTRSSDLLWWTLRMDRPGISAAADSWEFLGSGPDFDLRELSRLASALDLDPVGSAAVEGVDEA